jgi:hypothetical protein
VQIEYGHIGSIFVFYVDKTYFRILKGLRLNSNGYVKVTYATILELLSYMVQYLYPVFSRLKATPTVPMFLTQLFNQKVEHWANLVDVVLHGVVMYQQDGNSFTVYDDVLTYDVPSRMIMVTGVHAMELEVFGIIELVIATLNILSHILQTNDVDINPILPEEVIDDLAEEALEEEAEAEFNDPSMMDIDIDDTSMGPAGMEEADDFEEELPAEEETNESFEAQKDALREADSNATAVT